MVQCSSPECDLPSVARGFCGSHYKAARRAGLPLADRTPARCSVDGCGRDAQSRGMCRRHYNSWLQHRDRTSDPADLYPRVERVGWNVTASGCWEYAGARFQSGYANLSSVPAHRIVWAHHNGPIPDGLVVRHACDNPPCVNPGHLLVGTPRDNIHDMLGRGRQRNQVKTHCPQGHPLAEGNLAHHASPGRDCLTCSREVSRTRARLVGDAAKALGMTWRGYVAQYGQSRAAAERVLAEHGVSV